MPDTAKKFYQELEQKWRKSMPKFAERELLEIFPEAKSIVEQKIVELEGIKKIQLEAIKNRLAIVKHNKSDDFSKWFFREWIKIDAGQKLVQTENQIARLKRVISTSRNYTPKNWITDIQIQRALEVPIESLVDQPLRKSGKTLVGLCPLHNEKHPSFYVYLETNSCWCFGCNHGGNSINFIRLLKGFGFPEAVRYLIG
ncbi:MAG: CHC2 zinc finger domain-containing protein [Candidatus Paceibacterota bacterium]|jgi:hypothetical protein